MAALYGGLPQSALVPLKRQKGGKRITKKDMKGGFLGALLAPLAIGGITKLVQHIKAKKAAKAAEAAKQKGSGAISDWLHKAGLDNAEGIGSTASKIGTELGKWSKENPDIWKDIKGLFGSKKKASKGAGIDDLFIHHSGGPLGMFRRRQKLKEDGEKLRAFMQGLKKGFKGSGNSELATDVTNQRDVADLSRKIISWKAANPQGFLNPDSRKKLIQMLADHKKKTGGSIFDTYYTNSAMNGGAIFDSYDNAAIEGGDMNDDNYTNAALHGGFNIGTMLKFLGPITSAATHSFF